MLRRSSQGVRAAAVALLCCAACNGDDVTEIDPRCPLVALPLAGTANAPSVVDVVLEVQSTTIAIAMTATDPQGGANLRNVLQTVSVYGGTRCQGPLVVLRDDLVDSGVEETFGTVVVAAQNQALYDA